MHSKDTILIVDDTPKNIQLLGNILRQANYQIVFATHGHAALSIAKTDQIDLILLDVVMPELDGLEVCKRLQRNKKTSHIPVIFLTARSDKKTTMRCFKVGGKDFISKPFNATELLARVEIHINLKRSIDTIHKQNKQLAELVDSKDRFLSILAHDLRNPINGITLLTNQMLQKHETLNKDSHKRLLTTIHTASQESNDLLEKILEWSSLQMGKIDSQPIALDISHTIAETEDLLRPNLQNKQLTVNKEFHSSPPVLADPNMVKAILTNLLSNAIKFSFKKGVISISTKRRKDRLHISVADQGVGIQKERLEQLLETKSTMKTPGTEGEKGSGLGLCLCKEFIAKNGGELRVASSFGKGSTFTFSLPVFSNQPLNSKTDSVLPYAIEKSSVSMSHK